MMAKRHIQQVVTYSKVQGKSIVVIAITHAVYVIVGLLENSAHHVLITMWDMLVTWLGMGIYIANSKHPFKTRVRLYETIGLCVQILRMGHEFC